MFQKVMKPSSRISCMAFVDVCISPDISSSERWVARLPRYLSLSVARVDGLGQIAQEVGSSLHLTSIPPVPGT